MPANNYLTMKDITYSLVESYFHGRCSAADEYAVQNWFAENVGSIDAEAYMDTLFETISAHDDRQARRAYEHFCKQIGYTTHHSKHQPVETDTQRHSSWQILMRVAACMALPLLIAAVYFASRANTSPELVEIYVPYGQTRNVELPDGTELWLNSGSRITYPSNFGRRERKVYAEGEIFADVAKDPSRPFTFKTSDVDIKVLGTRFNLHSFAEDACVEVALVEGSVEFDTHSETHNQKVLLSPGEIVQYDRRSEAIIKHSFLPDNYRSFALGGGMLFYDRPLNDIVAQLERRFDTSIVIMSRSLAEQRYYAYFTREESLEQILSTVNADGKMEITTRDGVIFIK